MATGEERIEKRRKRIAIGVIAALIALAVGAYFWVGVPVLDLVKDKDAFRAWVESGGVRARILFVGMVVLQVVVAVIPGEPFEIAAGVAFGAVEGTILCIVGSLIGGYIAFILARKFGVKVLELFFSKEQIESVSFLRSTKKLNWITLIVFLIPGTPKDILTYAAGLTKIHLPAFLVISSLARLPSVVSSTLGGDALLSQNYEMVVWVLAITLAVSGAGILIYRRIAAKKE